MSSWGRDSHAAARNQRYHEVATATVMIQKKGQ